MTDVQLVPALAIWGDFGCPWSALISLRVDELLSRGQVEVEWRAVQLRPDLPAEGVPVDDALMVAFDEAVMAATPAERQMLRLPGRRPNTAAANERLAGIDARAQPAVRSRLFEALWHDDLDIGSPTVLELIHLPGPPVDPRRAGSVARQWQSEWEDLAGSVPALRDGEGRLRQGGPACLDFLEALR